MGDSFDEWLREERRRRALSGGAGARRVSITGGDARRLQRLRAARGGMSLPSGDVTFLAAVSGVAAVLTGAWLWYRKQPVSAAKVESHYLHGIDVTAAGS